MTSVEASAQAPIPGPGQAKRGEATREALLAAGLKLFAEHGFESVSTRALAAEAGANLAAVAYHFGGMRELYNAVMARCVDEIEPIRVPLVRGLRDGVAQAGGERGALARVTVDFVETLFAGFLADDAIERRLSLILREYAKPSEAFDILYAGHIEPIHAAMTELVEASPVGSDDPDANIIRAHAVLGQMVFFALGRMPLIRRLGAEAFSEQRKRMMTEAVTDSVLASLDLPRPASAWELE